MQSKPSHWAYSTFSSVIMFLFEYSQSATTLLLDRETLNGALAIAARRFRLSNVIMKPLQTGFDNNLPKNTALHFNT